MPDSAVVQFLGRLHPMLLHLPIGLFAAVVVMALVDFRRDEPPLRRARLWLAWLLALSSAVTAATGFILSYESGYGGDNLLWHMRLGFAFSGAAIAYAVALSAARRVAPLRFLAPLFLVFSAMLLVPAGHLGAALTHGENFLWEPFAGRPAPRVPDVPATPSTGQAGSVSYSSAVAPLLLSHCADCHGESRQRARLALHTFDAALAGGRSGPVVVAGDPAASELLRRVELPADDPDRMPPGERPSLSAAEIALLRAWIAAGAPDDGPPAAPDSPGKAPDGEASPPPASSTDASAAGADPVPNRSAPRPVSSEALVALRAAQVHAQPLAASGELLWVDFSPTSGLDESAIRALLEPVLDNLGELSLARTQAGDDLLRFLAAAPHLRRLDLRSTRVTSAALSALAACPSLQELVLSRTSLGDDAAEHLARLPGLTRIHLWESGVSEAAIAGLRAARPELIVETGAPPPTDPLETEEPPQLTGDAPLPGEPAGAIRPINALCPVAGTAVDPKFVVVFEGRAIGFCCQHCPQKFWVNPDAFREKLPPP